MQTIMNEVVGGKVVKENETGEEKKIQTRNRCFCKKDKKDCERKRNKKYSY